MTNEIHPDAIAAVVHGDHGAPADILGPHPISTRKLSIRAFRPSAERLEVVIDGSGKRHEMTQIHEYGFFEVSITASAGTVYHYEGQTHDGEEISFYDPYACDPLLTDYDLHLFGEGRYLYSYEKFGAHPRVVNGVAGVNFAVWAPNARRISIVGDFNQWDNRVHPMHPNGSGGVWELFIPGLEPGAVYKYDIRSNFLGYQAQKIDPYGFQAEHRPRTGSVVAHIEGYEWNDERWMAMRASRDLMRSPMSIYEMHPGSWRRRDGSYWLSYRELAHELVPYVRDMGYTHIELMPIMEHPLDASWGYQVTGYYAPTSRFGDPQDFMYFVDFCHQHDIGVILDWVPAHFPKDGHALSYFDGTHLYEHEDSRKGEHPDWGTYIFNYGRNEVRNFLVSNALYWLKEYHVDGLRVDAVSSMLYLNFGRDGDDWIPNEYGGNENLEAIRFIQEFNTAVHAECPGAMTIAEESTSWPMVSRPIYVGGLGFTFKWNMGWMHDTLHYMRLEPIHRKYHHNELTFASMYAFSENFVLALSHDEVVHGKGSLMGKMSGDWWQKFANLRLLTGFQMTHPGKKLMFMGQDIAQWQEWSEDRSLDWHLLEQYETHRKYQQWVKDINRFYLDEPALWQKDFEPEGLHWIEANHADESVYAYLRRGSDAQDVLIMVANFTPVPRHGYRVGVPDEGFYREMLNSDSSFYGGSNMGNGGGVHSEPHGWHGFGHSIRLTLPPLAITIFKRA